MTVVIFRPTEQGPTDITQGDIVVLWLSLIQINKTSPETRGRGRKKDFWVEFERLVEIQDATLKGNQTRLIQTLFQDFNPQNNTEVSAG